VATAEERRAVLAATAAVTGRQPESATLGNQVVWQLGTISGTRLMLVQVEPGAVGPGSAAISAAALVSKLDLDFFIVAGIGYGLRPAGQEFGDLLVCTQLRAIDHRKVAEPPDAPPGPAPRSGGEAAALLRDSPPSSGDPSEQVRGDSVTPSVALLSRFRAVSQSWTAPPAVHFGPMVSASMLLSSRSERDRLAAQHPDAIGGEMEGAGVYAAAAHAKVDWIVVKAISDFGFGKTDAFHERAARNAASFVIRAAELGFLDEAPGRGTV
jgi:nucleoside phosphorylase